MIQYRGSVSSRVDFCHRCLPGGRFEGGGTTGPTLEVFETEEATFGREEGV
jgi:hypothetical protein